MKNATIAAALGAALVVVLVTGWRLDTAGPARGGVKPAPQGGDASTQLKELRAEIQKLHDLVPDQAAIMSHLGYHWSNLWFAIDQENWPLADFYLSEVRSNLKWAVRNRPIRKITGGTIDIKPIAEALDNTQLTQLKSAIARKDKKRSVQLYDEALQGCYACHKSSEKPYLRPKRPTAPEVRVINFDPRAKDPP
jgi:hypothetical protein